MSENAIEQRRQAFEDLAIPLADVLYATAYRLTGNTAKAEDLVQEAFVRAWQNFDRFEQGTNFKAWIFKILIFVHKNEQRSSRSREVTTDFSDSQAPVEAPAPAADHTGVDWDALYPDLVEDEFKRALDQLDTDQRAVLMLVTLGELSYQECADALEVPLGTVMSRLFRARKRLQEELYEFAKERGVLRTAGPSSGKPEEAVG